MSAHECHLFSLDFIWALNFQVEMRKLWKLFNAQFMIQQAVISGFVKAQISLKCMIKCLSNWLSADWSAKMISFGKNIKVLVHPKMKIFIIYSFSCSKTNQQVENMTLISQLYIMQWVSKFRDPRPLQGSSNATASMVSGCYNKKRVLFSTMTFITFQRHLRKQPRDAMRKWRNRLLHCRHPLGTY